MHEKMPAISRGSTSTAIGSRRWRCSARKWPMRRISTSAAPLGMVQRRATNSAAVSGISSTTSTRTTISSAYCDNP